MFTLFIFPANLNISVFIYGSFGFTNTDIKDDVAAVDDRQQNMKIGLEFWKQNLQYLETVYKLQSHFLGPDQKNECR